MGTRGLLGFIIKGKKKGSYNHWDSYPSGLGMEIITWLKYLTETEILQLIERLNEFEW